MTAPRLPTVEDFPEQGTNSLAGIGQRGGARVLDEIITALPFIVVILIVIAPQLEGKDPATADLSTISVPWWVDVVSVACAVAYETVLIAWRGQTLGKYAFGVRVARYTDGSPPSWTQSAMRCLLPTAVAVGLLALGLPSLLVAVVYLTAMLNPMRRGWHDLAGGTVVVRTR